MNELRFSEICRCCRHMRDETADLINLNAPFNSKRDCNLLFESPKTVASEKATPGVPPSVSENPSRSVTRQ